MIAMTQVYSGGGRGVTFWAANPWWAHGASRTLKKIKEISGMIESAQSAVPAQNPRASALAASGSPKSLTREMISDRIKYIIAEQLHKDKAAIPENKKLMEELDADEIDMTEILMGIEAGFDIKIPDEDGEPASLPKSNVAYTPDAAGANGGYFVYGRDGFLWWLVDRDFKFQSIVGEHTWKEQKEAEAYGMPLMAADYDNFYFYVDGMVTDRDGNPVGRYYPGRYDVYPLWKNAEALFNTFNADNMLVGFRTMCDLYLLFPENLPFFEEISRIVKDARNVGYSSGIQERIFAQTCLKELDNFKQKCSPNDKIQRL
jgi:acyl carrier protein